MSTTESELRDKLRKAANKTRSTLRKVTPRATGNVVGSTLRSGAAATGEFASGVAEGVTNNAAPKIAGSGTRAAGNVIVEKAPLLDRAKARLSRLRSGGGGQGGGAPPPTAASAGGAVPETPRSGLLRSASRAAGLARTVAPGAAVGGGLVDAGVRAATNPSEFISRGSPTGEVPASFVGRQAAGVGSVLRSIGESAADVVDFITPGQVGTDSLNALRSNVSDFLADRLPADPNIVTPQQAAAIPRRVNPLREAASTVEATGAQPGDVINTLQADDGTFRPGVIVGGGSGDPTRLAPVNALRRRNSSDLRGFNPERLPRGTGFIRGPSGRDIVLDFPPESAARVTENAAPQATEVSAPTRRASTLGNTQRLDLSNTDPRIGLAAIALRAAGQISANQPSTANLNAQARVRREERLALELQRNLLQDERDFQLNASEEDRSTLAQFEEGLLSETPEVRANTRELVAQIARDNPSSVASNLAQRELVRELNAISGDVNRLFGLRSSPDSLTARDLRRLNIRDGSIVQRLNSGGDAVVGSFADLQERSPTLAALLADIIAANQG